MLRKRAVVLAFFFIFLFILSSISSAAYSYYASVNNGGRNIVSTASSARILIEQGLRDPYLNVTSPNPQKYGDFGISVATNGKLVIVGARSENEGGYSDAGRAYVFNGTDGALLQTLTSPNPQNGGEFGYSVSLSGHLALIGAWLETANGHQDAGRAYVFNVVSGSVVARLTSPNAQFDGLFGNSVSISGDLAIVGAPYENASGLQGAGRAYAFNATSGALIFSFQSPNIQPYGWFGIAVSTSGKLTIVGAPLEGYDGNSSVGRAYVFNATTGVLTSSLTSPNPELGGEFGLSVAISSKIAIVGAPGEAVGSLAFAGHSYVFSDSGSLLSTLSSPKPENNGYFGAAVSVSGKVAIIGTLIEHAYAFNVYKGSLLTPLKNPSPGRSAGFGRSVDSRGSLVIVGAYSEKVDGTHSGAAFLYD